MTAPSSKTVQGGTMFRLTSLVLGAAGTLLAAGISSAAAPATAPELEADLILSNADIYTPDGWAKAMAIKRGVILAVGDEAAAARYKGTSTQVMDLGGAAVVPGLHDMHIHPTGAGLWQARCMFPQGSSAQTVVDTVKGCVAKKGKGAWVTGGSWDAASFGKSPASLAARQGVARQPGLPERHLRTQLAGELEGVGARGHHRRIRRIPPAASSSATQRACRPACCANPRAGWSAAWFRRRRTKRT